MKARWHHGNRVLLLENGEEFFPRVFEAISGAQLEVFVETFIVFEDEVGRELQQCLIKAARRGARVELTVDGYGSADLTPEYVGALTAAGVRVHIFDPRPKFLGIMRTNLWRRMHRKLVVIDGVKAFVGGINFSRDHLRDSGPGAKQDYAVEVEGPVVRDIRRVAENAVAPARWRPRRWWRHRVAPPPDAAAQPMGEALAVFVTRDNERHQEDIERHYREAIRAAKREIIIANAYFFPGFRLLRDLRNAARRGVKVTLVLQGNPDKPTVRWAAMTLYDYLLRAGARIYEYCERPLHGKVALVDEQWCTVGSSNLDPLSLFLNLEANLVVRDRALNADLRQRLTALMQEHCDEILPEGAKAPSWLRQMLSLLAFHALRRFPSWAGWLPAHKSQQAVQPPKIIEAISDKIEKIEDEPESSRRGSETRRVKAA